MKEGIRMPGFTADTSLYKPRRHYNLGVSRGVDGQVVIPQAHMGPCFIQRCGDVDCVICPLDKYLS